MSGNAAAPQAPERGRSTAARDAGTPGVSEPRRPRSTGAPARHTATWAPASALVRCIIQTHTYTPRRVRASGVAARARVQHLHVRELLARTHASPPPSLRQPARRARRRTACELAAAAALRAERPRRSWRARWRGAQRRGACAGGEQRAAVPARAAARAQVAAAARLRRPDELPFACAARVRAACCPLHCTLQVCSVSFGAKRRLRCCATAPPPLLRRRGATRRGC
jgi:hypothetical protein